MVTGAAAPRRKRRTFHANQSKLVFRILIYSALILLALIFLAPFWLMLVGSLTPESEIAVDGFKMWPVSYTHLDVYKRQGERRGFSGPPPQRMLRYLPRHGNV